MPVGTRGTVKGLLPEQVAETGSQIILNNTYHLLLRPGSELIAQLGGCHKFMDWNGPILTDSGGFQVFSLSHISKMDEDGVTFRSHLDGAPVRLTPERSMQVQNELGADIIMAFDDCPPAMREIGAGVATAAGGGGTGTGRAGGGAGGGGDDGLAGRGMLSHALPMEEYALRNRMAADRTRRWLARCVEAHGRKADQALFGIVQGGMDLELRSRCAADVAEFDLPGHAIGGCAVGEGFANMVKVVRHTAVLLPEAKPRYLMGVGYARDLVAAVRAGMDMFDCVLPTRNGRNAQAFTRTGVLKLRNERHRSDPGPVEADCDCLCCRRFSRAYLRHLFMVGEMLGPILLSIHNIRFFQRLMLDIRNAIRENDWSLLAEAWPIAVEGLAE